MARETAHVHLVDDCPRRGPVKRRVAFPIVCARIGHHAFHRCRGIVAFLAGSIATVVPRHDHPRPYGSRRILVGSKRIPLAGSKAPEPDSRRFVPAPHRGRTRANSGSVRSTAGSRETMRFGRASSSLSKKSNSTPVAYREKRLKFAPPSVIVEPKGELRPILAAEFIYLSQAAARSKWDLHGPCSSNNLANFAFIWKLLSVVEMEAGAARRQVSGMVASTDSKRLGPLPRTSMQPAPRS